MSSTLGRSVITWHHR